MEYLSQLITLAGITFLACISPGPDFVAVTSISLKNRNLGIFVAIGIACSVSIWAALAILGFGILIQDFFWFYEIIRLAGAVYLIFLGIKIIIFSMKEKSINKLNASSMIVTHNDAFRQGLLVGLTNPKTATFFATLFVTLLPISAPAWVYISSVSIVFCITCVWLCFLATFFSVGHVQALYIRVRKPIDALMGVVLLGLGIRLATNRS